MVFHARTEDLTNKKFGSLVVLKFDGYKQYKKNNKTRIAYWKCKCTLCNKIIIKQASKLKEQTGSGCLCSRKGAKVWTKQDIKFLIKNYPIHGKVYCSKHLNRDISSIGNKAQRLKLKRNQDAKFGRPSNIPKNHKYCSKCKIIKHIDEFSKAITNSNWKICILCNQAVQNKYYQKHRERINKRAKEWYGNNPEKIILRHAKIRAKKQNVPFSLELSDIIIPKTCPVLGIPIIIQSGGDNSPSIDKFIPSKGYVKGNINIISDRANTLKNNATIDEIGKLYEWMKLKSQEISSTDTIPSS